MIFNLFHVREILWQKVFWGISFYNRRVDGLSVLKVFFSRLNHRDNDEKRTNICGDLENGYIWETTMESLTRFLFYLARYTWFLFLATDEIFSLEHLKKPALLKKLSFLDFAEIGKVPNRFFTQDFYDSFSIYSFV